MNKENLGSIYDDYLIDTKFDNSKINTIYQTKINNKFNYRGITTKIKDDFGNVFYIQLLANVDGEVTTIKNLLKTLLWGNMIVATVSIFASYVISKKTLDSLYESYNKQTEFVQNVAHELRTPLTIIQAKQQLLLEEPDDGLSSVSSSITSSLSIFILSFCVTSLFSFFELQPVNIKVIITKQINNLIYLFFINILFSWFRYNIAYYCIFIRCWNLYICNISMFTFFHTRICIRNIW